MKFGIKDVFNTKNVFRNEIFSINDYTYEKNSFVSNKRLKDAFPNSFLSHKYNRLLFDDFIYGVLYYYIKNVDGSSQYTRGSINIEYIFCNFKYFNQYEHFKMNFQTQFTMTNRILTAYSNEFENLILYVYI